VRLSILEALPRLALAVLEHLIAYGELLYEESLEAARRVRRSMLGFAIAAAAGFIAVELGCLWVIAATWNGPNRLTAVGGLCIGFVVIAVIGSAYAGAQGSGRPFQRVREEWRADMEELAALNPSLHASDQSSPIGAEGVRSGD
jgi:hypothetical protein